MSRVQPVRRKSARQPQGQGSPVARAITAPTTARRVLVISHSHPQLTKGGAEIAAYNHYLTLAESPRTEAWFLGCARDARDTHVGATFTQPFGEREYVYACGGFDWFNFSNMDPEFPEKFRALLREIRRATSLTATSTRAGPAALHRRTACGSKWTWERSLLSGE